MNAPPGLHCVPASSDLDEDHSHLVQFYDNDEFLAERVSEFVVDGLHAGESAIVVATKAHRQAIDELVGNSDLDLQELRNQGRYVLLDAGETLSRFMMDEEPEPALFAAAVGSLVAHAAEAGSGVRIFGEMVALLWEEGNVAAAIRLEELWNEIADTHPFSLLCGYPMAVFGSDAGSFQEVCSKHSHVIPTESFMRLNSAGDRLRAVTELQMQARVGDARALEAHHHALELNNAVVSGLAAAKMALELEEFEMLEASVADTMRRTTELVSQLMDRDPGTVPITPGDLRSGSRPK